MALTLARRERRIVVAGAAVLAVVVGYFFVVGPVLDRHGDLERLIAQKAREHAEVVRLGAEYRQAKARLESIDARLAGTGRDFQLLSYLEGLSVRNGVRDRIAYMRPQPASAVGRFREQAVEMRLDGITINQLTEFLTQLAGAPQALRVKRLSVVRRFDNATRLDVVVQVAAYQVA